MTEQNTITATFRREGILLSLDIPLQNVGLDTWVILQQITETLCRLEASLAVEHQQNNAHPERSNKS